MDATDAEIVLVNQHEVEGTDQPQTHHSLQRFTLFAETENVEEILQQHPGARMFLLSPDGTYPQLNPFTLSSEAKEFLWEEVSGQHNFLQYPVKCSMESKVARYGLKESTARNWWNLKRSKS